MMQVLAYPVLMVVLLFGLLASLEWWFGDQREPMSKLKKIAAVTFWAFVLLAMAGQIAGAETLCDGMPDAMSAGDGSGVLDMGAEFPWHYLVGILVACCCAIWL